MDNKRIFAFISYNHKDVKWAKWLRKRIEWYKLPSEIINELDNSKYIRPVFRDKDELNSGILNDSLLAKLSESKYLIVICSRNSAKSKWVSDEIQAFIDMGKWDHIIPFVVEDRYEDVNECFPISLLKWNIENPQKTILGVSVYDDNVSSKSKALIKVISCLLQLDFDVLWQRHKREKRAMIAWTSLISLVVVSMLYWLGVPVHLTVEISAPISSLPDMRTGIITICDKDIVVCDSDTLVDFGAIPGAYRLRLIPIQFKADRFYDPYISAERLAPGIHDSFSIRLQRDNSFAIFAGRVIDEHGDAIPQAQVCIGNKSTSTDSSGCFRIIFPFEEQSITKPLDVSCKGYHNFGRDDECPSDTLVYLLHSEKDN